MKINDVIEHIDLISEAPSGLNAIRKLIVSLAIEGRLSHDTSLADSGFPQNWRVVAGNAVLVSRSGNSKLIKGKLHNRPSAGTFPGYSASGQDVWLDAWEHEGTAVILSAVGARCGKAFLAKGKWSAIANTHIVWVPEEHFIPEYAMLILNNEDFWIRSGSAQPFVKVKATLEKPIGLPPLVEQEQILRKVDHLMNLCDALESSQNIRDAISESFRLSVIDSISTPQTLEELGNAWDRAQSNWELIVDSTRSISDLRTLILDLAIRGDLVKVGSPKVAKTVEWSAAELKLDSSKLWNLPTLFKEKKKGWNRIPLAKVGSWGSGGTPTSSRKDYYQNGTIPWAVIGDLNDDVMTRTAARITEKALEESSAKIVPRGAVLIAMYATSIGKTAITGIECCTNQAIAHCIVDSEIVSGDFFFIVAKSLKRHLIREGKGAAQPNISQSVLKHLIIDLPSLDEQGLIVEEVARLMGLCDALEETLHKSETLAEEFTRSIVSGSTSGI